MNKFSGLWDPALSTWIGNDCNKGWVYFSLLRGTLLCIILARCIPSCVILHNRSCLNLRNVPEINRRVLDLLVLLDDYDVMLSTPETQSWPRHSVRRCHPMT